MKKYFSRVPSFLLQTVTTIDAGVTAVRQGRYTAYLAETPTLQYFAGQEPCDLQNVGSPFGPSVYTLGLQRNSPYTRLLNRAMLQLKQNGQLDALKKKWVDDQNSCNQANSVSNASCPF
jgi:ABC-type amino acid transport substrate-binding protein